MIQLRSDCLVFKTSNGESIPCSAEDVAVELMGNSATLLDPDLIRNVASAVMHYFKFELGRFSVSIVEFSNALAQVLRGLGFAVVTESGPAPDGTTQKVEVFDLSRFIDPSMNLELAFFSALKGFLQQRIYSEIAVDVLKFTGLRPCVKQLLGVKRWSKRCQHLSDQVVLFLRECIASQGASRNFMVLVS